MRTTASRAWSNDLPNLSANCELSHTSLVGPLKTMTVVPVNICGLWDTESYGTQTATQKQLTFWFMAHSCLSSRRTRIWAPAPPSRDHTIGVKSLA